MMEGGGQIEDRPTLLDGDDPPRGEGPAVPDPLHLVHDRHTRAARTQEVRVQRVHRTLLVGRSARPPPAPGPATCPPKTRWSDSSGLRPRKMLTSISFQIQQIDQPLGRAGPGHLGASSLASAAAITLRRRAHIWPTSGHPDHRAALLVRGGEIDLGGDAPVVVAVRVGEGLPDPPQPVLRRPPRSAAASGRARRGPCPGRRTRPSRRPSPPPRRPRPSRTPRPSRPARPTLSSAASSTRRNIALRTRTRKARGVGRDRLDLVGAFLGLLGRLVLRVGELLPLVQQAGVDLPDHLAEPLDHVLEVLRLQVVGHGVLQGLVGARPGSAARCPRCGRARRRRRTRRRSWPVRTCRG